MIVSPIQTPLPKNIVHSNVKPNPVNNKKTKQKDDGVVSGDSQNSLSGVPFFSLNKKN